jgi:hypothetical protein
MRKFLARWWETFDRFDLAICYCGDFHRDHKPACWCGCKAFRFSYDAQPADIAQQSKLDQILRRISVRPPVWGLQ